MINSCISFCFCCSRFDGRIRRVIDINKVGFITIEYNVRSNTLKFIGDNALFLRWYYWQFMNLRKLQKENNIPYENFFKTQSKLISKLFLSIQLISIRKVLTIFQLVFFNAFNHFDKKYHSTINFGPYTEKTILFNFNFQFLRPTKILSSVFSLLTLSILFMYMYEWNVSVNTVYLSKWHIMFLYRQFSWDTYF